MYNEYLEFAKDIALYAGRVMMEYYNKDMNIDFKEDKSVVTIVDKEINHYLIEKVKEKYPTHSVNGEEESFNIEEGLSEYVWVCDPVDGTTMYVSHIPVFMFSLSLVYNGEPVVGVVYNPNENKMYTAIKDEGAYCNNERISVNNKKLGELGFKTNVEIFKNNILDELSLIKELKDYSGISSICSAVRACIAVASGEFSCEVFQGTDHGNCDVAASYLIVKEAGGTVTSLYGEEQRYDGPIKGAILSNGVSHDEITKIVKNYLLL